MITYYMAVIFQSVGLSHFLALIISGVNATVFFLSSIIPIWLVDRVGRKPLLIYGSIGMCVSMVVLVGTLSPKNPSTAAGVVSIICIFMFEVFFATGGWMATPFLYPSEISVLRLRSKGTALSILSKWVSHALGLSHKELAANIVVDVQLSRGYDYTSRDRKHWVPDIHPLGSVELRVHLRCLFLLPRDQGSDT